MIRRQKLNPERRFFMSRSGMTLLSVILLLMLAGALVTAGIKTIGPLLQRGKTNDTKTTVNSTVDSIISWSVSRGHLPGTSIEFAQATTNQFDAWGRQLRYLYDKSLISATGINAICRQNTTGLTVNSTANIAFTVMSIGDDYAAQSAWNTVAIDSSDAKYMYPLHDGINGPINSAVVSSPDIYRVVTLNELQSRIGCFGRTGGRLRIVNNELPVACIGNAYSATIFSDGGILPYTLYSITGLPVGLTASGAIISGTPTTSGTSTVSVSITDSHPNTVHRTYNLNAKSCAPTPPGTPTNPVTFLPPADPTVVANNWNGGSSNDQGTNNTTASSGKFDLTLSPTTGTLDVISIQNGTSGNCIWYQAPLMLTGKKMRAYFSFVFTSGEGFVFAMVPSLGQTTISSCDENSALGFGSDIPGSTLLGLEFYDPNLSTCITTDGSQCTGSNSSWSEGIPYYVRVELDATVTPNPVYKVWLTSNPEYKNAFENLTAAYSGTLPPLTTTKTLSSQNISDLSSFFLGFTASQHGNDKVNMVLSGLKFVLY